MMKLRVAILQFNPKHKQIQHNINTCNTLLSQLKKPLDILVLPEMCFTGYVFENQSEIQPYINDPSPLQWAKQHAKSLNCYLAYGTPHYENHKFYNSLFLVNPNGELQFMHHKSHLYELDESWSDEGNGFYSTELDINGRKLKCSFGICMDMNPKAFKAPYEAFEFANACKAHESDVVICSNNWLHPDQTSLSNDKNMDTIYYWVDRLRPLIGSESVCLIANRSGIETHYKGKTKFAGSSCILKLNEQPVLHDVATQENQLIYAEMDIK
eukprot:NODE_805_length_3794_cov_0.257375.p1 type:complete len:269 gc:universal NODE_805_length_3794_cov_0.257375:2918-2112(-)